MSSPIERYINEDPGFSPIDSLGKNQGVVRFPVRDEPENSFFQYRGEDIELDPTALLRLAKEDMGSAGPLVVECLPFQYKDPRGTFQKKIHYLRRYREKSPRLYRAFYTFEPSEKSSQSPPPHTPYLRVMCGPIGNIEFSLGLKNERGELARGEYENGKLTYVHCPMGESYGVSFKERAISDRKRFGEIVTSRDLGVRDVEDRVVNDGRAARLRRMGKFLRVDTGFAIDLDHPIFSMDLLFRINPKTLKELLQSTEENSLLELPKRIFAAFRSSLYGVNINTIPINYNIKTD